MLCPTRLSLTWQIFAGQRWALSVLEAQTQFDSEAPAGQFMSLTRQSVVVIPPTEGLRLSGILDSNKISDCQKNYKIIPLSMLAIQSSQVLNNLKSEQWSMRAHTHTHTCTHTHTNSLLHYIFCTKLSNDVMVQICWKYVCKLQPRWHWQWCFKNYPALN